MSLPREFRDLAARVRNWGRWGEDDQRGTLNLVTDDVVRAAAGCVRRGARFSLALPLSEEGPQAGLIPGRENPRRTMIAVNEPMPGVEEAGEAGGEDRAGDGGYAASDDKVEMGLQAATHWDALAHVSRDGRIYNGASADSIDADGAAVCGIEQVGALVTRGVLLDIPRTRGLDRLEPGEGVTPDDLDAAVEAAGVDVGPGDAVLVRTGQIQHFHGGDRIAYAYPSAGLTMACAGWFHDRDVAAVATDTLTMEVYPGEHDNLTFPVHLLHLVEMGLLQGQNFDLEALAVDCADDGTYEFLLSAPPEPFVHGLGAPVHPVAVK